MKLLAVIAALLLSYSSHAQAAVDKTILPFINAARAKGCTCGEYGVYKPAKPVKWNDKLAKAAIVHTNDNYSRKDGDFGHTGSDHSSVGTRVERQAYNFMSVGENIAIGSYTAEGVVEAWLTSPGHCKNIMDPYFKDVGVAKYKGIWTLVIGIAYDIKK